MGGKAFKRSITSSSHSGTSKPRLLAGGNPQIPKGEGDAPVEAYLAAMQGWKQVVGRRLDSLILESVCDVRKAVKWNTPFYGITGGIKAGISGAIEDKGWFVGFHCYTKFIKVAFFRGTSLQPEPPGESKSDETRYLNIRERDQLDEAQFTSWVQQAAALPGWIP